jgi:hypothetical protein
VLQHWLALLQQGEQLRQLAQQLQQLLAQRSSSFGADSTADSAADSAAAGMLAVAAVSTRIGDAGEAMQLQELQQVTQEMVAQVSQLLQVRHTHCFWLSSQPRTMICYIRWQLLLQLFVRIFTHMSFCFLSMG